MGRTDITHESWFNVNWASLQIACQLVGIVK